jgi:hypothetical protein
MFVEIKILKCHYIIVELCKIGKNVIIPEKSLLRIREIAIKKPTLRINKKSHAELVSAPHTQSIRHVSHLVCY